MIHRQLISRHKVSFPQQYMGCVGVLVIGCEKDQWTCTTPCFQVSVLSATQCSTTRAIARATQSITRYLANNNTTNRKTLHVLNPVQPRHTDTTVVRIAGQTLASGAPLPGDAFPGDYPLHFYRAATGVPLPNEPTYAEEFRNALKTQLLAKVPCAVCD